MERFIKCKWRRNKKKTVSLKNILFLTIYRFCTMCMTFSFTRRRELLSSFFFFLSRHLVMIPIPVGNFLVHRLKRHVKTSSHWSSGAHHHVIWNKSWGHRLFLRRVIQSYTSSSRQFCLEVFFFLSLFLVAVSTVSIAFSHGNTSAAAAAVRSTISEKSIELLKKRRI